MPTLAELAGIDMPKEDFGGSTAGQSAVPLLKGGKEIKAAAVSQFPRVWDGKSLPHGIDHIPRDKFTHMGYSIRTEEWRYTEWRTWDGAGLKAHFGPGTEVARELYDHRADPSFPVDFDSFENENLAEDPQYAGVIAELSATLQSLVDKDQVVVV